ncbi:MAG TPA: DNA polymerase III subunit delta [Gemmatimonadaceae bacterium]|nr:DNA polymerase III subunit delta [Gemmatimonadaceae bacterium]
MSVSALRALRTAIERRQFDPVYYLHGDDEYRKGDALNRLIAAALDASIRDLNLDLFHGADTDAERLAAALSALPMLAERRVAVVRNVGTLKKQARAVLDRHLAQPLPDTILALVSPAGEKPDAAIESRSVSLPFAPLAGEQLAAWIVNRAEQEGMALPDACARIIMQAAGDDLTQAVGELSKLASFTSGRAVTPADVEAIVGVRHGETIDDLLDAVAARNGPRAIALVAPVLAQPKSSGVQLVMFLAVQALAIAYGRERVDAGLSPSRLENEFFGLLKSGGGYPGRSWRDAAQCWAKNVARWTASDARAALTHLHAADLALKDTRVSSEEAVISSLVLALCAPSSRAAA